MKKILIFVYFILMSFYSTSQIVDSVITYIGDSVTHKSIYNHDDYSKTVISFYKGDSLLKYAKWVYDSESLLLTYYRGDTIYFKSTDEDLGDMKVTSNYFLNENEWELCWTTVRYYSIPTFNLEIENYYYDPNFIVFQNNPKELIVQIVNVENSLKSVGVFNVMGQLINKFDDVQSNTIKISVPVNGLYIIKASIETKQGIIVDTLRGKKINIR